MQINITDITETKKVAIALSKSVTAPKIILLSGNLGSGKSTFARFFINHKLQKNIMVQSPTFGLINVYKNICHCDFYRLKTEEEILQIGFIDYLNDHIILIEWPDIAMNFVGEDYIKITFTHENNSRKIIMENEPKLMLQ